MAVSLFFTLQLALVLSCLPALSIEDQIASPVPIEPEPNAFSMNYVLSDNRFFQEQKLKGEKINHDPIRLLS